MDKNELKERTKRYALRVVTLVEALPATTTGKAVGNQLIRSGTSVGANYRAALRARSKAEFIAKLGTVIEEADESAFWLEIIIESKLLKKERVEPLLKETNELIAIFFTTRKSSKQILNGKS
ncbi:four helix bundle protein [Candidatus Uhrbacteria bacterium]|nr:four helix bundle protein [Candidatus Uhrbacteria bacterium]